MKKNKWIIDAIALVALLLVFLPGLTGFALHEWIGLVIAGVLLVHFLQHWNWVISTSQRLGKLKGKVLGRYLVDGGLALGFITITVTGLVISSLLMLPLENYAAWGFVHVISSYLTAFLLAIKLVMHWDMIAKMLRKVFGIKKEPAAQQTMTIVQKKRREVLRGAGITTIAGVFAFSEFKDWQNTTIQFSEVVESIDPDDIEAIGEVVPMVEPTEVFVEDDYSEGEQLEPTTVATQEPTAAHTATLEPIIVPTATQEITGVVKCGRGCSYPGKCGRYVDDNQNGKCDLGEPIW